MRVTSALVLCVAAALAGCVDVQNMEDLKVALGAAEPEESLPALPPIARAMAFPTVAKVGEAVYFTAAGSADPEGEDLAFLWTFDDGARAVGAEARHAYRDAGSYRVELMTTDDDGLWDVVGIELRVLPANLPPVVGVRVLDARGADATRTTVGAPLTLEATALDPEAGPVSFSWDLGDGGSSTEAVARHAWDTPGRYTVALTVTDAAGLANRTTLSVPVDLRSSTSGVLTAGDVPATIAFPVGPAQYLTASVTYDASLGADLRLRIVDAAGTTLAESDLAPAATATGPVTEIVVLDAAGLAAGEPGAWRALVERVSGVRTAYTLDLVLEY